ncbi:MAG: manganese efflux pump [Oligoflexia bacterium]|nr:manganese efflux pump [Oligoflexia bacterium]
MEMNYISLFMIALALSLDALAVSLSCSIKLGEGTLFFRMQKYLKLACFFGCFQALMPIVGQILGNSVNELIFNYARYADWIAFTIFLILGIKTLYSAFRNYLALSSAAGHAIECKRCYCQGFSCVSLLGIATSIDALLVGPVLAVYNYPLIQSALIIGVVTFIVCFLGALLSFKFGRKLGNKAELLSGLILIGLSIKILSQKSL